MSEVPTFPVCVGVNYHCNPQHRDANPNKAQWIVTLEEEYDMFSRMYSSGWVVQEEGWGYHLVEGQVQYCGHAKNDKKRYLVVAKFVVDRNVSDNWHGYPADPANRTGEAKKREIPPVVIQSKWLSKGELARSKIRKLGKGEPCNL